MSPRAVVCAAVDSVDDADGLQEECLYNTYGFEEEYSYPPRFAAQETFEMDFGNRWKALEELERSQIEIVKIESAERKKRLEQEMHVGMGEEQVICEIMDESYNSKTRNDSFAEKWSNSRRV